MTQYFYMRLVYGWPDPPGERICTYGDQKGYITTDPYAAFKQQTLAHERMMHAKYGMPPDRAGDMFAYWRLDKKMPWHEALPLAKATPPERVCVMVGPGAQWAKVDFVLPPGVLIEIDQYESVLPKKQRST